MIDPNLVTAIVSASGAAVVAVASLLLNNKRFDDLNKRLDDQHNRFDCLDHRLDVIEQDLKQFYRVQGDQATDIARLKDTTGMA